MSKSKVRGWTAREAVDRFCTYWTRAGYLGYWPRPGVQEQGAPEGELDAAHKQAAEELIKMLRPEMQAHADSDVRGERTPVPLWAIGFHHKTGRYELIPGDRWMLTGGPGFLELDIERNRASGGGEVFEDLQFFDSQPERCVGGAPAKFDWVAFDREVRRVVDEEGWPFPGGGPGWTRRADLQAKMAEWCQKKWGEEPSPTRLRDRLRILETELNQESTRT